MTNGWIHGRNVDILNDAEIHGSNCNNFGYKSMGDNVPDVITTLPNRLNRGAIANDESRHANCIPGFGVPPTVGYIMIANRGKPSEYVATNEAKSAMSVNALKSSKLGT